MTNDAASDSKPWLSYYTSDAKASIDYDQITLASNFRRAIKDYGDRSAMWFMGAQTSYKEFGQLVAEAADVLSKAGVKAGDKVAVVLPNCPQNLVAFYAITSLGATAVYHNPLYTARELEGPFKDHAAKAAVFWDNAADIAETLVCNTPLTQVFSVNITNAIPKLKRFALSFPIPAIRKTREKLASGDTRFQDWDKALSKAKAKRGQKQIDKVADQIIPETGALILYTSGTTGNPKGAVLTHRNLCANILQGQAWVPGLGEHKDPERMLAALPMFHAYGMTMNGTLAPLIGGEMLLLPAPEAPLLAEAIKKRNPTWVPGVPALYQAIMSLAEEKGLSLSGVRNSFSGASSLPVKTVEAWEKATGGRLVEGYGLTETSPIVIGNPMSDDRRPGYIGVPFPDTDAKVVDQNDPSKDLDYGEEGELVVRGPQVFHGYLNQEDKTAETFIDDWFRTGDMAVMESDGFIKIVSRIKETIVTGGFNVHPGEVEGIVSEHPRVKETAVVGREKEDGSECVVAAVVLADDAKTRKKAESSPEKITGELADSLRKHSKEGLTGYKVPRAFYQIAELPTDQMGKVRRSEVQELLAKYVQDSSN